MTADRADPGEPADVRAATDAYDRIVAELAGEPGVDMGRIFHSEGLNLGGGTSPCSPAPSWCSSCRPAG